VEVDKAFLRHYSSKYLEGWKKQLRIEARAFIMQKRLTVTKKFLQDS
jgi:hypothetical protein